MLTEDQVKAFCRAAQSNGQTLGQVMAWAFGLDRKWGSVDVKRVWLACKAETVKPSAPKPETFPQYLNRVGNDHRASAQVTEGGMIDCPTAEDYFRAADTIEDLQRALARMVDAFERDDMSCYGPEERRATSAANRLLKSSVMGK